MCYFNCKDNIIHEGPPLSACKLHRPILVVPYKSGLKIPKHRKERVHQKTGIKNGAYCFFLLLQVELNNRVYMRKRGASRPLANYNVIFIYFTQIRQIPTVSLMTIGYTLILSYIDGYMTLYQYLIQIFFLEDDLDINHALSVPICNEIERKCHLFGKRNEQQCQNSTHQYW